MKSLIVGLMSLMLFVQASTAAQPTVSGQVRLSGGLAVAGAQVMLFDLTDLRRGAVAQATTDADGQFALPLAAVGGTFALPQGFALGQNYPNPFNPATIIPYRLAAPAQVQLDVFNTLGQPMATLVDGEQGAGAYSAQWDGTDAAGQAAAAGLYFYRLTVDGAQQTGRMVLVDGQAGIPMGGGRMVSVSASAADDAAYGLVVAGQGLVTYVDADFDVAAGMPSVVLEVEAQPDVRMKVVQSGLLGDVDNNGRVDIADALVVAVYSANPSISLAFIARGDVNCDGAANIVDAWLIATYVLNPSDPVLPSGIGQVGDCGNTGRVIFSENYEDYRTGTRPSDYIIVYNGQGDSQQRVAEASGNKYLRTAGAPNWGLAMRKDFDFDLPAQISVSWRMRVNRDLDSYTFTHSTLGDYAGFGSFGVKTTDEKNAVIQIRKYRSDGRVVAECGTNSGSRPEVKVGTWVQFQMDIDFDARRVKQYMNGVQLFCERSTGNVNLNREWNSWGEASGIRFVSQNSGSTVTLFDDIVIRDTSGD